MHERTRHLSHLALRRPGMHVTPVPTSQPTPIVEPKSTTSVVTTVPNPMHTEGKMMLWEDLPKRDDMAKMPGEYRTIDHWKEISAVTNAIINIAPCTKDKLFWGQSAIAAAFEHPEVVERLRLVNPSYVVPGDDNNGNKFRTMAIMEMLTGLSVELAEKEGGADVSASSTIIKYADQTSLTSWLYGNLGTLNDRNPLRWNPTVTYFSGGKLEPLLMNSTNAPRFSVQDCRAVGPDYFDDFTPDWDLDAFQVDSIFVWAARLRDLELDLNKAEYRRMIESRSVQTAYFEYGTPW
ncbi:hypothetical protein QFC22_000993 [Naganishia vaughanmartiniae]|uniref:Uncharacterized protein n=1 Tax=Naganishia vaughanmartiniae TaxID=1424756 RepID=A0ACC2XMF1_9TREE|nr:hypothetical protein QFC22_000993 [Naganishia vaughanmartiniae]